MNNGIWSERPDVLGEKSLAFAVRVVRLSQHLIAEHREFVLSKQILRSGTAVGAMIREGRYAQSPADFVSKLSIALKEASETEYWLILLKHTGYIPDTEAVSLANDCAELLRLLTASINTAKTNLRRTH